MTAGGAPLAGRLQRTLLGMLAANANRPVTVDALVDALWPEPDPRARQRLQLHVHKLRRELVGDRLSHGPAGYTLRTLPGELDAERFESLVAEALGVQDPARRARLLRDAVALWRGTPYEGLDVPALAAEARRLDERRLAALEERYDAEIALGGHAEAAVDLAALTREHPLRERFHGLLMVALYRGGRQAEALEVYRRARATMVEELGVEPGPGLRAVEAEILAGETARPAQLPPDVTVFVNRAAELAELDSAPLVAITGTAGVGKTALAVRWAHRARERFPDGQLYVDLCGYATVRPLSPDEVLAGFLRALGAQGAAIPTTRAERLTRLRSLASAKRLLVILDNAVDADHVRPLLFAAATVVTSRDSLAGLVAREGAHRVVLTRLAADDAERLLARLVGGNAPAGLAEQCARLPLALRVAAELVRFHPAAAARLSGERALDLLDAGGDPATAVRSVFSWSYRHLPADAARLFRLCGHGVGNAAEPAALAALVDLGERETVRALAVLVRAHLVEQVSDGRYHLHDLLREYAAELADPGETEAAVSRQVEWYTRTAEATADRGWLGREVAALVKCAELRPAVAGRLSTALWRFLDDQGRVAEALALHTRALAMADDPEDRARFALRIGIAHLRMGDHDTAERFFTSARNHPVLESAALNNLAMLCTERGDYPGAARFLEAALALCGDGEGARRMVYLTNLGELRVRLGRLAEAEPVLRAALAMAEDLGDRGCAALALCHMAHLHLETGQHDRAAAELDATLALARQTRNLPVEAEATMHLGTLRRRLGDRDGAVAHFHRVLELAELTGQREQADVTRRRLAEIGAS
ncbi:BTAD domain-containing putative transcriptional regulator [Actinokineospora sp. UTMC 2448]|uniref:AfsR/SARP family transcriptional regulator n=1 Tax=Actinokineospora sp. UTMC 2448 TaxID=2268449 RepID=UPI002164C74B|nr:BTAD domain-containing putative transcriptional regulator [Actinokineospora sp. UTMC 2448]